MQSRAASIAAVFALYPMNSIEMAGRVIGKGEGYDIFLAVRISFEVMQRKLKEAEYFLGDQFVSLFLRANSPSYHTQNHQLTVPGTVQIARFTSIVRLSASLACLLDQLAIHIGYTCSFYASCRLTYHLRWELHFLDTEIWDHASGQNRLW